MIIRSHWLTAALSLALLALFAAVPAHAKEPGTDPSISSGTFMWKNVGSGLCLEVSESGGDSLFIRKNGTPLWLNGCNASRNSQWWTDGVKAVPGRPTMYSYTSSKSRMCMDTAGGKTAHGTVVVQGACTGSNSQYWLPNYVNAQNERNIVASFDTSKCLDTEYGKKNATVPVVIGQCTGSSTQKWLPIQVTDPTRFNKVNRVGVHNAYDKATASSLIDLLNTSPGMIEIDLHGRGGGKWDVFHGSPGEGNNCSQGIHLEGCLSDIRKWHDQNPSHNPLVIKLEMKTDFVGKANTEAQLNAQLRKSLGVGNVFQPFDLMCKNRIVVGACTGGYYTSPQEAVDSGNWPTFTQMKGKILLYLVQSTGQLGVGAEVNWAHFTKNKWKTGNAGEFSVAFPGVLNVSNASTPDPRNDSKVLNQRAPKDWFVVFDGDAKGISNNTNVKTFLQSGKYLATGTDSQKLGNNGQGVDRRTASPDDILKIIDKNVKNGITFTSSDWFEPRQNALVGE